MFETPARQVEWDHSLRREAVEFHIGDAARDEFLRFARDVAPDVPIGHVPADQRVWDHLAHDVNECRTRLEAGPRLAVIRPLAGLDARQRRVFAWIVANLLGEPLVQNSDGDRVIAVYARPGNRRIIDGARYHQSREGGGPHTDNVNIPEPWEHLVFSCIRPAAIGGESILIDGFAVHRELRRVPEALRILERPFSWEYRGINDGVFEAPIVAYDAAGRPHFRYLRKYLESAHARAGAPLSDQQVWALDVLDATLDRAELQWRTHLAGGEILVTVDSQVFHARTAFADAQPGGPATVDDAAGGAWRFFDRVWVRRRPAPFCPR
jgi:hypothetical protein